MVPSRSAPKQTAKPEPVHNVHVANGIGETLRKARNRRKLPLFEIEAEIKIRARYLRAIEAEEWDALPDGSYARSFIRTYANYLGLDGDRLAAEFGRAPPASADRGPARRPPSPPGASGCADRVRRASPADPGGDRGDRGDRARGRDDRPDRRRRRVVFAGHGGRQDGRRRRRRNAPPKPRSAPSGLALQPGDHRRSLGLRARFRRQDTGRWPGSARRSRSGPVSLR